LAINSPEVFLYCFKSISLGIDLKEIYAIPPKIITAVKMARYSIKYSPFYFNSFNIIIIFLLIILILIIQSFNKKIPLIRKIFSIIYELYQSK